MVVERKGHIKIPRQTLPIFCQFGKILVLRMDSGQAASMTEKLSMAEQDREHRHAQAQAMGIWRKLYTRQCCRRETLAGAADN